MRQSVDKGLQYDNIKYKMQPATRGWTLNSAHTELRSQQIQLVPILGSRLVVVMIFNNGILLHSRSLIQ